MIEIDIYNIGKRGELEAYKYLEKDDYYIVQRNFKCKFGEIDIIAIDKNEIVFVEVKTRSSKKYGEPRDSVDKYKKKHIRKAAEYFIMIKGLENKYIRFDVVEIYLKKEKFYINHIKNIW